jgi:recombination protein RecA
MARKGKKAAAPKAVREEKLAKASAPERLVAALRERFKDPAAALLMKEGGFAEVTSVCPTGIDVLDRHIIGIGGLPYGQITEVEGEEGTGKTSLLARFMAAAQRDGALVAFTDAETKFVPSWGAIHGLDLGALVQVDAENLEAWQERADYLLTKVPKGKLMIALDSIASLPTKNEYDRTAGGQGEHSRVWTEWGRQFKRKVYERQALVVWLNQPRSKIGVMYGPNETTFGGRWLRHAPLVRLKTMHGQSIKDGDAHVGKYVGIMAQKNQLAPPFRKAKLRLDYATGFNDDWSTLNHAKDMGCIDEKATFIPKNVREARANLGWPVAVAAPEESPALEAVP